MPTAPGEKNRRSPGNFALFFELIVLTDELTAHLAGGCRSKFQFFPRHGEKRTPAVIGDLNLVFPFDIAAAGETVAGWIGRKMDKAAAEAKKVEGAQVELVDVNGLPAVKVTFESGILFGFNSSTLSSEAKASLAEFASVLKATPDADVAILGHTDNVGSDKANQSVSEKRAKAVANFLVEQGTVSSQIKDVLGMSHTQPIASNDTEEGKAQNRRVEVYMYASQAMIDAANEQAEQ